jgi:hypothetical protein
MFMSCLEKLNSFTVKEYPNHSRITTKTFWFSRAIASDDADFGGISTFACGLRDCPPAIHTPSSLLLHTRPGQHQHQHQSPITNQQSAIRNFHHSIASIIKLNQSTIL